MILMSTWKQMRRMLLLLLLFFCLFKFQINFLISKRVRTFAVKSSQALKNTNLICMTHGFMTTSTFQNNNNNNVKNHSKAGSNNFSTNMFTFMCAQLCVYIALCEWTNEWSAIKLAWVPLFLNSGIITIITLINKKKNVSIKWTLTWNKERLIAEKKVQMKRCIYILLK